MKVDNQTMPVLKCDEGLNATHSFCHKLKS